MGITTSGYLLSYSINREANPNQTQCSQSGTIGKLSFLTYVKKGVHIMWNFRRDPLKEHLIFSNCIHPKTDLIQWVWEGGVGDFHFSKINFLANSVQKAITSAVILSSPNVDDTLNSAMEWSGSICMSYIFESVLNTSVQKAWREGQAQNIWVRLAGCWSYAIRAHISKNSRQL